MNKELEAATTTTIPPATAGEAASFALIPPHGRLSKSRLVRLMGGMASMLEIPDGQGRGPIILYLSPSAAAAIAPFVEEITIP